jgi:hypothetical protein
MDGRLDDIWWTTNKIKQLERDLERFVYIARLGGCTWSEIGEALGTSRQAASSRFGHVMTG